MVTAETWEFVETLGGEVFGTGWSDRGLSGDCCYSPSWSSPPLFPECFVVILRGGLLQTLLRADYKKKITIKSKVAAALAHTCQEVNGSKRAAKETIEKVAHLKHLEKNS